MKPNQDYEKLVIQIQSLKKVCANQKIAHQATINQLQVSYELNQQLQSVIKQQSSTIGDLNKQLNQKTVRLSQMSASYEMQLKELKQFVNLKDRELQGIRGSLMVTDYDMIRLRVISQLELVHREQLEQLNKEIQRITKIWEQQKTQKNILMEKLNYLKKELDKQKDSFHQQIQQATKKNLTEYNKMREKFQKQVRAKRQIERLHQTLKQKHKALKQTYESQINKSQEHNEHKIFKSKVGFDNYHTQTNKIGRLQQSIEQKNKEIQNMKRKMQRQQARNQQVISDLESKLKEAKQNTVEYNNHTQKMREKQSQLEQLRKSYEKKIKILKQDFNDELRKQKKQGQTKIEEMRQRMKLQKQNYNSNFQYNLKATEKERFVQRQKQLEQKIMALQKQNAQLAKQKYSGFERTSKIMSVKQTKQQNGEKTNAFRLKLQQANRQIVNLLKEKVNLKQQISQLKR